MNSTIGIVVAMPTEADRLIEEMKKSECETSKFGIYDFYHGKLGRKEVVLGVCHPGKVNAAAVTTILITRFSCDEIINIGIAASGRTDKSFGLGDIVAINKIRQYDVDTSAVGDPKEFVSGCNLTAFYPMLNTTNQIAYDKKIPDLELATGDTFVDSEEVKQMIDSDVIDMEGGAVAQVCVSMHVPFLCFKCISDTGNANEYVADMIDCAHKIQSFLIANIDKMT